MTAQITEVLLMDGEQLTMAFCPLLPMEHPRIRQRKQLDTEDERALLNLASQVARSL